MAGIKLSDLRPGDVLISLGTSCTWAGEEFYIFEDRNGDNKPYKQRRRFYILCKCGRHELKTGTTLRSFVVKKESYVQEDHSSHLWREEAQVAGQYELDQANTAATANAGEPRHEDSALD